MTGARLETSKTYERRKRLPSSSLVRHAPKAGLTRAPLDFPGLYTFTASNHPGCGDRSSPRSANESPPSPKPSTHSAFTIPMTVDGFEGAKLHRVTQWRRVAGSHPFRRIC